jgi:hypothetical protein
MQVPLAVRQRGAIPTQALPLDILPKVVLIVAVVQDVPLAHHA